MRKGIAEFTLRFGVFLHDVNFLRCLKIGMAHHVNFLHRLYVDPLLDATKWTPFSLIWHDVILFKFVQGVPVKVTEFSIEIILEISGLENQFRNFCKAGTYIVTLLNVKYLIRGHLVKTGVS